MAVVVFRPLERAAAAARGPAPGVRACSARSCAWARISVLSSLQTVLTAVILTGFVGRYGAAALAGYGVGLRLELLQIPLVFAVGQALVVLVGTHIGAGRAERAKRIAWIGAALRGFDQPGDRHRSRRSCRSPGWASSAAIRRCSTAARATCAPWRRSIRSSAPASRSISPRRAPAGAVAGARRHRAPRHRHRRRRRSPRRLRASSPSIALAMVVFGLLTIWFRRRAPSGSKIPPPNMVRTSSQ